MDREDGVIKGGTQDLVTENYDAQEGDKLNTSNMQAMEFNAATGGSRISVLHAYRSPGLTPLESGRLFLFRTVVAGSAANILCWRTWKPWD